MSNLNKNVVYLLEIIAVATVYYFSAKIGQIFAIPPGNITPIWLPSGIMLAWMIIRGYRIWPGIFLGAFAGNATAYMDFTDVGSITATLFSGTMNGIGDVICVALAVYLIKRFSGSTNLFKNIMTFWQFLLFGVALGPLISALFGVGSLTIAGLMPLPDASIAFLTWWLGDSVGALLITPVILAFYFPAKKLQLNNRRIEIMAYLVILIAITVTELYPDFQYTLVADPVFLMIPLLFWSIFRFGNRLTLVTILLFFSISLYQTTFGDGVFNSQIQLFSLLQMQMYFMVVSSCVFIIGAMLRERTYFLEELSDTDSFDKLTNAGSRDAFNRVLDNEIERARRYARVFSLVVCDLDHFKSVNNRYGYHTGDEVLKTCAELIQSNLRQTDTVYRWSGEEFIIILPETEQDKAYKYAEKMRRSVAQTEFPAGVKLTVSVGVCQYDPELSKRELLTILDGALDTSRNRGRNQTTVLHEQLSV